jgi:signal transduction histidine kinase
MADIQILRSLFQNLINNSIKFTPTGGAITVTSETQGAKLQVCVSDTGIGIPEKEIPNLFRIDTSFKRSGTEKEAGTGLGLILCKEYIEILNGTISVTSTEGEGSKFCMILPKN